MAASHASKGLKLDKSAGTFAGILKIENIEYFVVRVSGYNSIPAAPGRSY
jgi:hypothetical protein